MDYHANTKSNEPQGTSKSQNIPLIHGKMLQHKYLNSGGKGASHTIKHTTMKISFMVKLGKIYSIETIIICNAETTTRGIRKPTKFTDLMPGDPSYMEFIDASREGYG